ncbi:endocytosis ankyrin repeat protein [Fusarium heterosporum]|uniref:Endocytosis ankyrin repeat protein n=1 Tax=Fusarium heterosporum TaxID=42747 RepID=A0A8H5TL10_FUSHE|nr:endocytosis ankyrin repeat protein [Fusarium heterosporum]
MSGLEILGAIASSIALAQAVKGTLKAIDFLRQNSKMRKGCNNLRKEILMIEYFISQAKEQTSPMMPTQRILGISSEHPLVSLTAMELEEILEELTKIVEKYSRSRKVHDPKRYTDKMKWFSEASKIEELGQRAQAIKTDLHIAITFRVSSMVDRGNVRQEVLFHRVTQQLTYHNQETQDVLRNRPQLPKISHSMSEEGPAEMSSPSITNAVETGATIIKEESLQIVRTVRPLGSRRCANCRQGRFERSGTWARSLLGSWLVKYKPTQTSCQGTCGSDPGVELEYRLPKWLWEGILSFHAYRGPTISCALRPARDLRDHEDAWMILKHRSWLQIKIEKGYVYFPDDTAGVGWSMINIAAHYRNVDCIEILLKLWENILPRQGIPKEFGYQLERERFSRLESGGALNNAIDKVMTFVNDWDELSTTKVHIAAVEGGLLAALQEQPWAIDQFSEEGQAPIHYAVDNYNFAGLEQLIQAGADVNQPNHIGQTPLMITQYSRNEMGTQKLLEYDECRRLIDKRCPEDMTALHYAIDAMSPECVKLLLEAGASTSKIDRNGGTCLHILSNSYQQDQQAVDEVFHLLQVRGADLEARDKSGNTPLMKAILSGNITVLEALLSAGASLDAINSRHQNILWLAARSRDFRVIDCLAEQGLENIDPQLLDSHARVTALCRLTWILEEDYDITSQEPPTSDQQQAFITLYLNLLIRDLTRLADILIDILSAAETRDSATVAGLLGVLVKKNKASFRHEHAAWYRGLQTYINDDNWEYLAEAIIEECTETVGKIFRAHDAKSKTIEAPEMREFYHAQS